MTEEQRHTLPQYAREYIKALEEERDGARRNLTTILNQQGNSPFSYNIHEGILWRPVYIATNAIKITPDWHRKDLFLQVYAGPYETIQLKAAGRLTIKPKSEADIDLLVKE